MGLHMKNRGSSESSERPQYPFWPPATQKREQIEDMIQSSMSVLKAVTFLRPPGAASSFSVLSDIPLSSPEETKPHGHYFLLLLPIPESISFILTSRDSSGSLVSEGAEKLTWFPGQKGQQN